MGHPAGGPCVRLLLLLVLTLFFLEDLSACHRTPNSPTILQRPTAW